MIKKRHHYILVGIIAALMGLAAGTIENIWLLIGVLGAGIGLILFSNSQLEDRVCDERDYRVAEKAARAALIIYVLGGALGGVVLMKLGVNTRLLLSNSACGLLLIYFVCYFYYRWRM